MIWAALIAWYIYAHGGAMNLGHFMLHQAKDLIKVEVKNPAREKDAQESLKKVQEGLKSYLKAHQESAKDMKKLYDDYQSTPAQFDSLFKNEMTQQDQLTNQILQDRQTMLKSITPAEWNAIIAGAKKQDAEAAAKAQEKAAKEAAKEKKDAS